MSDDVDLMEDLENPEEPEEEVAGEEQPAEGEQAESGAETASEGNEAATGEADEQKSDEKQEDTPPTMEELQARVEALEKEKTALTVDAEGKLKALTANRKRAQTAEAQAAKLEGKLEAFAETIAEAKRQRASGGTEEGKEDAELKSDAVPGARIKFAGENEDIPYIPAEDLAKYTPKQVKDLQAEVATLKEQIEQTGKTHQTQTIVQEASDTLKAVIAEDQGYAPAMNNMVQAFVFLNNALGNKLADMGKTSQQITRDQAYEILEGDPKVVETFQGLCPGVAMDDVCDCIEPLNAGVVPVRKTRTVLKKLASTFVKADTEKEPRAESAKEKKTGALMDVLKKPASSLADTTNQKGSASTPLDVLDQDLDIIDLLEMDDKVFNALDAELKAEELREYAR